MENAEEVMQLLEDFSKSKPKEIPRELEDYLLYVAKTGDPVFNWALVKNLFREKLINVMTDFFESTLTVELPPCPNVESFSYERMKASLLERFDTFSSAPFTVQRICELLTNPRKEYNRADKYMRAIEKNILVVSTREPGSGKRPLEPEIQTDAVMNGIPEIKLIDVSLLHIPTDLPCLGAPPASNDVTVETTEPNSTENVSETEGLDVVNGESAHTQMDTEKNKESGPTQEPSTPLNEVNQSSDLTSEICEVSKPVATVADNTVRPSVSEENTQGKSDCTTDNRSVSLGLTDSNEDQTHTMPCINFESDSNEKFISQIQNNKTILPDTDIGVDSSGDHVDKPLGLSQQLSKSSTYEKSENSIGSDENEVSSTPTDVASDKCAVSEIDEPSTSEAEATDENSLLRSAESNSLDLNLNNPESEVNSSERIIGINESESLIISEVGLTEPNKSDEVLHLECNENEITGMPIISSPPSPNISNVDSQAEGGRLDSNICDNTSKGVMVGETEQADLHPDSSGDISLLKEATNIDQVSVPKLDLSSEADSISITEEVLSELHNDKDALENTPDHKNSENIVISSANTSSTNNSIKVVSDVMSLNKLPENNLSSNTVEATSATVKSCSGLSKKEVYEPKPSDTLRGNETANSGTAVIFSQEKREDSVIQALSSVSTNNLKEIVTIEEISVDPSCETEEEAMDVDDTSNQMMVSEGENEGEPMDQSDQQQS